MRAEEEAIQQAEEDAREQLVELRKIAREERDVRRKIDLEKKKQYAQAKRDKERAMMEQARKKEQEMLERIADAEMRRSIREEEERKRDEEDRLAQERYEVSGGVFKLLVNIILANCVKPVTTLNTCDQTRLSRVWKRKTRRTCGCGEDQKKKEKSQYVETQSLQGMKQKMKASRGGRDKWAKGERGVFTKGVKVGNTGQER